MNNILDFFTIKRVVLRKRNHKLVEYHNNLYGILNTKTLFVSKEYKSLEEATKDFEEKTK